MNWGTGIVISFVVFIAMIFTFIFLGGRTKSDLVADDYYAQELAYESVIEATRNTLPFADSIYIRKNADGNILFTMPAHRADAVNGHIYFFRPADADLDRTMDLAPDASGQQIIPASNLVPGRYTVKISWNRQEISYYWEKEITL